MKMAENVNVRQQFDENRMEFDFDEKIVIKVDDSSLAQEILKNAFENQLFFDVTLITEADSTR